MAIRWPCPQCGGGYLFLTFRGNTGYSAYNFKEKDWNSVYIHYQKSYKNKRYGPGTVMRMRFQMDSPAYTPKDSPYSVQICELGNDFVKVSLGRTPTEAQERCSQAVANVFYTTTTTTTTASRDINDKMYEDPDMNDKKCGIWRNPTSMAKRVFKLSGAAATETGCRQACTDDDNCIAMSGQFGRWCIGCNGPLDADHAGTVAFSKQ